MLTEEILHKTSRTGTTAFYFVPNVTPEQVPILQEPAYVVFDSANVPIAYGTYSGLTQPWILENVNNYEINVQLSSVTTNFITGYSVTQTFNTLMSSSQRAIIESRFNDNVTNTITAQTQVAINYPTYVFFEEREIDDMFVNVKLSRTYETLDTLQIYNKPINSIPNQEAKTGILFGRLEAVQTLKDESGNNIRIPLKNVPIGIFNASEEFPLPVSLDDNGDRFFMNLKESSTQSQYFDSLSFNEDQKFLKTASQFVTVPDKYKFVTVTNDNGEFVIYNAPIGNQTIVFEADLFKQGLTKDEIILNNFPFPTDNQANIGEFPCYYFNQVPVDVVPAWGTNQTGYTEVNIHVNLDLRKWATYIFAPATYGNEKLETTVAKNITNTFKIQVRDMTNSKFAAKTLEITQIPNDLDRREGAKYLWFNEILDQRQQLEFFKFGCHVLKLPANLYDPNGFRTDSGGTPTNQKGVWLAAYQFRTFVNLDRSYRDTGGYKNPNGDFLSHFGISYISGASPSVTDFSGYGKFPYEKPWSITYPEPYSITQMPTQNRFIYGSQRTYQSPYILEEPAYLDGDLVGRVVDATVPNANAGGYGVQQFNGVWFPNQISYVATHDFMYKYEKGVAWNESYSNGYEPYWSQSNLGPYTSNPILAGLSSVKNGEKYQRVECGYGYFMKYNDWNRVYRTDWSGDIYFDNNIVPGTNPAGLYGSFKALASKKYNTYNLDDQNLALAFDQFENNKQSKNGIDIYRIVNSGLDNILIPKNFLIPTSVNLSLNSHADMCFSLSVQNTGVIDIIMKNAFRGSITVYNASGATPIASGQFFSLESGKEFYVDNSIGGGVSQLEREVEYTTLNFPGNAGFDSATNKYTSASYHIRIEVQKNSSGFFPIDQRPNDNYWASSSSTSAVRELYFNVGAYTLPSTWFVNSESTGSSDNNPGKMLGITSFGLGNSNHAFYSLEIESSPGA